MRLAALALVLLTSCTTAVPAASPTTVAQPPEATPTEAATQTPIQAPTPTDEPSPTPSATPSPTPTPQPTLARATPSLAPTGIADAEGSPAASGDGLVRHGPRDSTRIALTFDADMTASMRQAVLDGEAAHYDARIIALLRETSTKATLFITGLWAKTYPSQTRSFASDPLFELANHSWDHRAFRSPCYGLATVTTDSARRRQISRTVAYVRELTGVTTRHFRFPGGCHSSSDVSLVYDEAHIPVQWDVVSGDPFQTDASVIVDNVLQGTRGGSIIVMHMNGRPNAPKTYRALRTIIPELKSRGYRFVTLSTLLGS